jgi:hypothetical protein
VERPFDLPAHTLYLRGDLELAAAFGELFVPEFVEVDGCVIRADQYEAENFAEWRRTHERREVEAVLNHLHIWDLFRSDHRADDVALMQHVGQTILRCWEWALAARFPEKRFEMSFGAEDDGTDVEISFWQVIEHAE